MSMNNFKFVLVFVPVAMLAMTQHAGAEPTSSYCKYYSGPLEGTIRDYSPTQLGRIGAPCYEESSWGDSRGVVVEAPVNPSEPVGRGKLDNSPQSVG